MKSMLIAGIVILGMASAAVAAPAKLTDRQLDTVTAGAVALPGGPNGPPHIGPIGPINWPPPPEPVGPPVVNPGGPILISCIVGVGCTTHTL